LPTGTVDFVRKDAALEAERRFHGRFLLGAQMKVSVKESSSLSVGGDEEFWKKELQAMPKRRKQIEDEDEGFIEGSREFQGQRQGQRTFVKHDHRRVSIFDRLA